MMIMTKDNLIRYISSISNRYGDKLLQLMDECGVDSLRAVTQQQVVKYCENHGLLQKDGMVISHNVFT